MASSLARFRHLSKATPEKMICPLHVPPPDMTNTEQYPTFTRKLYFATFPMAVQEKRPTDTVEARPTDLITPTLLLGSGKMGSAHLSRRRDFIKYSNGRASVEDDRLNVVWVRMDARLVDYVDAVRLKQPFALGTKADVSPFICKVLLSFRSRCPSQIMQYHLVCEYWKGQKSFCTCLQQAGKLSEQDARFYIMELTDALIFIHRFDKIFRRLCSCCLLVKQSGHLLLCPYTLCSQNLDCGQPCNQLSSSCGDQFYASPEVVFGVDIEKGTDWWSCGVLMYQMVSGKLPFSGQTLGDLGKAITEYNVAVPAFISQPATLFIKQLLHKDVRRRLGTGKCGTQEIRQHPFFASVDWRDVISMKLNTEPPFKEEVIRMKAKNS